MIKIWENSNQTPNNFSMPRGTKFLTKKEKKQCRCNVLSFFYLHVHTNFEEYFCFMFLAEPQTRNVTGTASGQNKHSAMLHLRMLAFETGHLNMGR